MNKYAVLIYRPLGPIASFLLDFQDFLSSTVKLNSILLTGDFNIHVDNPNFSQHVSEPIHTAGHILDLVFTQGLTLTDLSTNNVVFSDHKAVSFNISCYLETSLISQLSADTFLTML